MGAAIARPWGHKRVQGPEDTTACPQASGKGERKWRKMAADSQLKQFTLDYRPQKKLLTRAVTNITVSVNRDYFSYLQLLPIFDFNH